LAFLRRGKETWAPACPQNKNTWKKRHRPLDLCFSGGGRKSRTHTNYQVKRKRIKAGSHLYQGGGKGKGGGQRQTLLKTPRIIKVYFKPKGGKRKKGLHNNLYILKKKGHSRGGIPSLLREGREEHKDPLFPKRDNWKTL